MSKQSRLLWREVGEVDFKLRGLVFFFFNFWVCVLKSGFVLLLFLFKIHLNLNSCDFLFLILFWIFYLVKINKLIFFFNLDANMTFFNDK